MFYKGIYMQRLPINKLYARVVKSLGASRGPEKSVSGILADVCAHFGFAWAAVYTADHRKLFYQGEFFSITNEPKPADMVDLSAVLSAGHMEELFAAPVFYSSRYSESVAASVKLARFFRVGTFVFVPIKNKEETLLGFVLMADRRGRLQLDEESLEAAYAVLTIVSNHVELGIYQKKLEQAQEYLTRIMDHMGIDIYVTDFYTHEVLFANKSMALPYGGVEKMVGRVCWEVLYEGKTEQCDFCPQPKLIDENGQPTKLYSWDYQRPFDGSWFRVFSAVFHWVDGRLAHVISSVDITENKNNEMLIRQLAYYDTLTGLPNRRFLLEEGEKALGRMDEQGAEGYILFFDLDNFKQVNDTMGHDVGDALLAKIGETLQENPLTKDRVYRHGGDEFVVLCENTDRAALDAVTGYILERFSQPWWVKGEAPLCRASVGVVRYPADGREFDVLVHKADVAMYEAKKKGKNMVQFYRPDMVLRGVNNAFSR